MCRGKPGERRSVPARQHRGGVTSEQTRGAMPHPEDAAELRMEPARRDAPLDAGRADTRRQQLLARHVPVLPAGEPRDLVVE